MAETKSAWIKFKDRIFKKKEEKLETALDQMIKTMKFVNSFAYIGGFEFSDDWKYNGRCVWAVCFHLLLFFDEAYTLYSISSTDRIIVIAVTAFTLTVLTKLTVIISNHKKYMAAVQFVVNVFECNSSGQRQHILVNVIKKIKYHFKINIGCILCGTIFYTALPLYDFIFNGHLTVITPIWLPFVNTNELRGYFINTGFNIIVAFCGLNVCTATSCLFLVVVDAYDGLVSLIEHDFAAIDVMCEKKERGKMYECRFRNLMMGMTDLARFSFYTKDLFKVIASVQVAMSYLVVVACTTAFLVFKVVSGIGGALVFFTEMLMYCYMGQLLDDTNNRMVGVICTSKWYTYEVKYQKDMAMMLYIAQNLRPIYLANVRPLDFNTGLKMTNNIYSLIMFLLSQFE